LRRNQWLASIGIRKLAFRGTASVIPTISTRKHQWSFDRDTYKARNFASAVALAAIVTWWTD
jgi:hypothetical protein